MSVALVLDGSVISSSEVQSGKSSGACHRNVPVIPLVDMVERRVDLESPEEARPKSAKQARPDGVISMLT